MTNVYDSETGDDGREPVYHGAPMVEVRPLSGCQHLTFVRSGTGSIEEQLERDYGFGGVADRIAMGLIDPRDFAHTR